MKTVLVNCRSYAQCSTRPAQHALPASSVVGQAVRSAFRRAPRLPLLRDQRRRCSRRSSERKRTLSLRTCSFASPLLCVCCAQSATLRPGGRQLYCRRAQIFNLDSVFTNAQLALGMWRPQPSHGDEQHTARFMQDRRRGSRCAGYHASNVEAIEGCADTLVRLPPALFACLC